MDMRSVVGVLVCLSFGQCAFVPEYRGTDIGMLPPENISMLPPFSPGGPEPDLSYCQMILEAPVPPTADQVPWYCICSACSGNRGQKGDRGDRGMPGVPGSRGPRGLTGLPGRPGFTGRPGIKGEKGDMGDKGNAGPAGISGAMGDRGSKVRRVTVVWMVLREIRVQREKTVNARKSVSPYQGPDGAPGLPGSVGPRGLPGLAGDPGPKGLKGDPGMAGVPGVPGASGQKGDQGLQGLCDCHDGAPGAQGEKGDKGDKGSMGLTGPQGLNGTIGPKGNQGDMGMMGMPGPCSPAVQSAFSAALLASNPLPNRPVPFKRIIYNANQHYNPDNGVYTAPVNGTYVFSYHLQVSVRMLKVGLFRNFEAVLRTTTLVEMNTASLQVVLSLTQGDWVWLQVKDTASNGMYTSAESSSTFSGFLLYPDKCDDMFGRDFNQPDFPTTDINWGIP